MRLRETCLASNTTPMPPRPSSRRTSKSPRRLRGLWGILLPGWPSSAILLTGVAPSSTGGFAPSPRIAVGHPRSTTAISWVSPRLPSTRLIRSFIAPRSSGQSRHNSSADTFPPSCRHRANNSSTAGLCSPIAVTAHYPTPCHECEYYPRPSCLSNSRDHALGHLHGRRSKPNMAPCRARSDNSFMIFTALGLSLFPAAEKDRTGNSRIRGIWGRLQ